MARVKVRGYPSDPERGQGRRPAPVIFALSHCYAVPAWLENSWTRLLPRVTSLAHMHTTGLCLGPPARLGGPEG